MTDRPSRSYKHGRRGRHKHADSPETKRWEQISGTAWLVGEPAPEGAPQGPPGSHERAADPATDPASTR